MKFTSAFHDFNAAISVIWHCTEMLFQKGCILSNSLTDQDKSFVELHCFIQFGFCLIPRVCTKFFSVSMWISVQVEKLFVQLKQKLTLHKKSWEGLPYKVILQIFVFETSFILKIYFVCFLCFLNLFNTQPREDPEWKGYFCMCVHIFKHIDIHEGWGVLHCISELMKT